MENNYEDIIKLERYLEKSLSEEEMREVESRLSLDPGLRELYQNEKKLVNGIRYGHLKTRLEELKDLEASLSPVSRSKDTLIIDLQKYWKPLAAAASVIVVIGSFLLWDRPQEPEKLYAEYFKVYPNVFEPAVRGTPSQNERAEIFAAYERGDYARSAEGFRQMLKAKPDPGILLLLGNSNLMLGDAKQAKENFITLSKDFDELDLQAKWYLSMCYLKLGEKDSAKVLLEEIAGGVGSYKEKANELLKKLD